MRAHLVVALLAAAAAVLPASSQAAVFTNGSFSRDV